MNNTKDEKHRNNLSLANIVDEFKQIVNNTRTATGLHTSGLLFPGTIPFDERFLKRKYSYRRKVRCSDNQHGKIYARDR